LNQLPLPCEEGAGTFWGTGLDTWGHLNQRLQSTDGMQLTLFQELKDKEGSMSDKPKIYTHASGEQGLAVNAYLVETENGAVAIDATLTVSEARARSSRYGSPVKRLARKPMTDEG